MLLLPHFYLSYSPYYDVCMVSPVNVEELIQVLSRYPLLRNQLREHVVGLTLVL